MAERQSEQMRRLQDKIKLLQGDLELSQGISDELEKRVQEMSERAEGSFLNSPTYRQMRMKMEFLEASMKRKEEHLKAMEGLRFRTADAARRLIEDGQGPAGDAGSVRKSVGMGLGTRGVENPDNASGLAKELARTCCWRSVTGKSNGCGEPWPGWRRSYKRLVKRQGSRGKTRRWR